MQLYLFQTESSDNFILKKSIPVHTGSWNFDLERNSTSCAVLLPWVAPSSQAASKKSVQASVKVAFVGQVDRGILREPASESSSLLDSEPCFVTH